MLQWLRDNLRSFAWTLWVVIIAFIVLYIPDFLQRPDEVQQSSAARVGNYEIAFSEYERMYRGREAEYRQALGDNFSPEMVKQLGLERQVLSQLVNMKLLTREAELLGFEVSEDEIRELLLGMPELRDAEGKWIGEDQYRELLRSQRFGTPADFEQLIREDLLRAKLIATMQESIYVPEAEVERAYRREAERATVRYLQLTPSQFAGQVEVSPAELESHFEANREQYRRPEQRVLTTLLVDLARLRQQVEVDPADVRAYYDGNTDEFTQQEQVRARHILLNVTDSRDEDTTRAAVEEIRRRIAAGEDFGALARELSEDPQSQNRGGELGFFGRGSKPPAFEEAAFGAAEGDIVGPVRNELVTGVGFHLIEILSRREGGLREFETVQRSIESRLRNEAAQVQAETRAGELATSLRGGGATPESIAEAAEEVELQTTTPFGQQDLVPGYGRVPGLTEAAWQAAVGDITEPIKVPRGWVIARLDEVLAPAVPELSTIEAEVQRATAEEKQRELAQTRAAEARSEIEAGRPFGEVANELGLEITSSDEFGHGGVVTGLGVSTGVTEAALKMTTGAVGGPVTTPQGIVLFEVTDRKTFDPEAYQEAKEDTRGRLESEQLTRLQQAIISQRLLEADLVEYNGQLAAELGLTGEE